MELEQYSQLKILDGPVCVPSAETGYSYWFWKVVVTASGEIGWVAEGDDSRYQYFTKVERIPANRGAGLFS